MNKKEKRIMTEFPSALDAAVTKKFGVECKTEFDFFGDMKHKTYFKAKGQKKREIEIFIEAWIAGNTELRERLESANN